MASRNRGFELVSKYEIELENGKIFVEPSRATKYSACYDVYNNTGNDIVLLPGEMSTAITTYFKSYMCEDEVLMAYIRSGHGFKYSVRLANSTGIIDCVPAGTLISTPIGDIKIEDLFNSTNRSINSFNEEGFKIEEDCIEDIWIVDDLDLLEIEMIDGVVIKIPKTKEVYTKRGWVRADELTNDDMILSL